jgi:hypothetical protein
MDGDRASTGLLERNPWVTRRKFDVAEYYRLAEAGILHEDDRVELIEGEIVAMVPIGSDHSGTVNGLNYALMRAAGDRAMVTVQNPLRLSDHSEPQPDFMLLKPRADFYRGRHPLPEDVLLLVEVSNSSLRYDREVKLPLYARHGIPEVWIVDVAARAVEVHRRPAGEGYAEALRVAPPGGVLEPSALPGLRLPVADILG